MAKPYTLRTCAHLTCSRSHLCTTKNTSCCAYVLKTALNFLDTFFRKHNMTYVIVYGTLLGAVRNGTVIPWTKDIDIGLFDKKMLYTNKIRDELYKHGYHLFEVSEMSHFHLILIRNSISLDINSLFLNPKISYSIDLFSYLHIGYQFDTSLYTFQISRCNTTRHTKCEPFVAKICCPNACLCWLVQCHIENKNVEQD